MKRQTLVFLLVVSLAAILAAGCATTKRAELIENRLGVNELDLQMTREKLDKLANSQQGFTKDLGETKTQLSDLAKETVTAINQLKKANANNEAEIVATKTQVQALAQKSEDLEKGIGLVRVEMATEIKQAQKEYSDLRAYVRAYLPTLRRTIAEREARHSYKADEVEGLVVCFAGPFEDGKSEINNKNEPSFEKALALLKDYELLEVHCFADKRPFKGKTAEESIKKNVELSAERGKATQAWLKTKGIDLPDEKIIAKGSTEQFGLERDCRTVVLFGKVKPPTPAAKTPQSTKP